MDRLYIALIRHGLLKQSYLLTGLLLSPKFINGIFASGIIYCKYSK